jgi:hypothetical protein
MAAASPERPRTCVEPISCEITCFSAPFGHVTKGHVQLCQFTVVAQLFQDDLPFLPADVGQCGSEDVLYVKKPLQPPSLVVQAHPAGQESRTEGLSEARRTFVLFKTQTWL